MRLDKKLGRPVDPNAPRNQVNVRLTDKMKEKAIILGQGNPCDGLRIALEAYVLRKDDDSMP